MATTLNLKTTQELRESRRNQRLDQWKNLFTDHIYMVLNRINPGMKVDSDAVKFIAKILILVLDEFVEQGPETIADVQNFMKKLFPSTWATFVVKHTDFKNLIDKPWIKKKSKDDKSKEAKMITNLIQKMKNILKENTNKNIDDRVVFYIHSVFDEIVTDIIKWSSISINKFASEKRQICKKVLIASIYTDRGLSELMEKLLPGAESDYCATDIYSKKTINNDKKSKFFDYDKICQRFEIDENSYLTDLTLLVNVFKRRLEKGIGDDQVGKQYINSIFGNINDIFELTFRILRAIEEVREMSTIQSMGAGLSEFSEGCEFESYSRFMEIFKEPIENKINALLSDSRYTQFFDEENKISFTPDGQCMRMAFKYVLPLYLHSVAAHFDGYYHYVTLLIKASNGGTDKIELQNLETHLKSVSATINNLDLPPCQHKKYNRLKDDIQAAQHISHIQNIQRSIEDWQGREIGFMCKEYIREGSLCIVHRSPSVKDHIRGKTYSERYVFLFDHLLVICKKTKPGLYKYKQQIKVQCCDIFDLPDDDELKNAFRIRVESRQHVNENTDIVLFCETAEEKHDWMTSMVEMQTAGILHRLLDSYNREMEIRAPLVLPTPKQYRFAETDTDDNIIFEDYMRNSGTPVVKSGTLIKLVERLTYPAYSDNDYIKTFFMTYRTFCSTEELFNLLIERFNIPLPLLFSHFEAIQSPPPINSKSGGPLAGRYDTIQSHGLNNAHIEQQFMRFRREYQKPIQYKVFCAFNHWINHHFYDFLNDTTLLKKLKDFLSGKYDKIRLTNDHLKRCKKLLDNVIKKENTEKYEESATKSILAEQSGTTIIDGETITTKRKNGRTIIGTFPDVLWHYTKKGDIENYDLMTLHPVEIGRQITLLHFHFFSLIKPIELVGAVFAKKDKNKSPQLRRMIHHSNMLSFWLQKSIVETENIDERVEMLSRILEILYVLEQYNNFNGILSFFAAITSSAVHRLHESLSRLNKEKQQLLTHFRELCDSHHAEIKKRIRTVNPPCVPFPGALMSQLFFCEEQNKTFINDHKNSENNNEKDEKIRRNEQSKNLISFVKCRKIAKIIKDAQLYQLQQYMFKAEPTIMQFFENLNPLNGFKDHDDLQEYLYQQSCKLESREGVIHSGKPKYSSEALKSPGIKSVTTKSHKSLKSPKSPSALTHNSSIHSNLNHSPDDSHFGIVDINPGQLPKYIGDSGRINQAFSNDTPLQTPTSMLRKTPSSGRKIPLSPNTASIDGNHFSFPPKIKFPASSSSVPSTPSQGFPTSLAPGGLVLNKPPAGRRKPPPPLPTTTRRPPPPIPCEPGSSTATSGASLQPSPSDSLTTDFNTSLKSTNSSPPKSPTVSLMVPLPRKDSDTTYSTSMDSDAEQKSPALCPPRPPKSTATLRRSHPSSSAIQTESESEQFTPPPLPPKSYRKANQQQPSP